MATTGQNAGQNAGYSTASSYSGAAAGTGMLSFAGDIYAGMQYGSAAFKVGAAGARTAKRIMEETEETLRRKGIQDAMELSQGRADVAAAGLRGTGSSSDYLTFLRGEREKESQWIYRAGVLKAKEARARADAESSALKSKQKQSYISAVGSMISMGMG